MAMNDNCTWDALRLMRMHGKKPALPVIVTTKRHLPKRLEGVGCLTILHEAGTSMPVQLLDGLEVIFFFDRCELASHVLRLAKSKDVKFSCKTWCKCVNELSLLPMGCDSALAAIDWAEKGSVTHAA